MHAINVGKWDISSEIVNMMVINQQRVGKNKMDLLIHMIWWWESG